MNTLQLLECFTVDPPSKVPPGVEYGVSYLDNMQFKCNKYIIHDPNSLTLRLIYPRITGNSCTLCTTRDKCIFPNKMKHLEVFISSKRSVIEIQAHFTTSIVIAIGWREPTIKSWPLKTKDARKDLQKLRLPPASLVTWNKLLAVQWVCMGLTLA